MEVGDSGLPGPRPTLDQRSSCVSYGTEIDEAIRDTLGAVAARDRYPLSSPHRPDKVSRVSKLKPHRHLLTLCAPLARSAALATLLTVVAYPGVALADPLAESEPNESVLEANGPIPPDGWVATRNTSNDVDYAWINLQASQQISVATTKIGSCSLSGYDVSLRATDVYGREQWDKSIGINSSATWTTPALPVRLSVRYRAGAIGCTVLVKIAPTASVLNGPLPEPPVRSLQLAAPLTALPGAEVAATLAGSAADGDAAGYAVVTGKSTCPPGGNFRITWSPALVTGPFSVPLNVTVGEAGVYVLCGYLRSSDASLDTLTGTSAITVAPPAAASVPSTPAPQQQPASSPVPSASISTRSLRRGERFRAAVQSAIGKVAISFVRGGKRRKLAVVTVRDGQASTSTSSLRAGSYRVTIRAGGAALASATVRIR